MPNPPTVPSPNRSVARRRPVVLLPTCSRMLGAQAAQIVLETYLDAVRLAGAQPLVVPAAHPDEIDGLLELADGVLLTGSPNNVHPSHFGEPVLDPALPLDPRRDAWTLPLIRRALTGGVPLLAVCRGLQEVNVALGGSLHQAVQAVAGRFDHREPEVPEIELQYGPAHPVEVVPGGRLAGLVGLPGFAVNSLHGQGVARLASGLRVEALAPDGQVEAFSMPEAPAFNLALQWHPEWQAASNPVSMGLLDAFGRACRERCAKRRD